MNKILLLFFAVMLIFSCTPQESPDTFTDSRDGHVYKTVTIGEQVWMAENLAYLPAVSHPADESYEVYCYYVYGYDGTDIATATAKATQNYKTYGVLYNWPAAMTACPEGWHLPSDAEWTQLEEYLIANGYNYDGTTTDNKIAISMASATGWNSSTNNGAIGNYNNTDYNKYRNKSSFSALPGGYRDGDGTFNGVGRYGFWWSSTEYGTLNAWLRRLTYSTSFVPRSHDSKEDGFSVRCVRD
ncbi:MAG: FISUMP domain-containing protein [Bacteroidales bacterium]|nr:FISUMP domain-containing protein [Bacteroidales bacterium]